MAKDITSQALPSGSFSFHFSLRGLIAFCVALIAANAIVAFVVIRSLTATTNQPFPAKIYRKAVAKTDQVPQEIPPWGELITHDLDLELPDEYVASGLGVNRVPEWTFAGMASEQVRDLMLGCGFTSSQIAHAFSADRVTVADGNTIIHPDEALILSLTPVTRANFYRELAKRPGNPAKTSPFCFPAGSFEEFERDERLDEGTVSLVKSLLYRHGDNDYFSDYFIVSQRLGADEERRHLLRALSRQEAVITRLRVRPTTDIDKLLGYWTAAPGVRFVNLRPLLDSVRRTQDGSTVSILYLLPPFARERLYTFPLPSENGVRQMSCHWTTMNFFNQTPDDRFFDTNYCLTYILDHYYQVASPTQYGDLVFLLDESGQGIHSAVYVADDIVFTKNGIGFEQPWILMRLKNLVAKYSSTGALRIVTYRNKVR